MRTHTSEFKNQIKLLGREIDSKITYTLNNEEIELGASELNSITPLFKGALLKSVMKELDVDSNVEIPLGTEINYQFGMKVNGTYEYLDFGNYIVNKVEKEEDTYSWKLTCYDKMLYSMVDYEDLGVTYPITIRSYINAICTKLGLTFANSSDEFCNYNREIQNELFLDSEGNSLDYTYRDVLDQLAEVTGSIICINNDDELELRYIEQPTTPEFEIVGSTTQSGTPSPSNPIEMTCKTGDITETIGGQDYTFSLGNIKLDGIGTYIDRIYKSNGTWYLEKKTIRKILTGGVGETWGYSSQHKTFYVELSDKLVLDIPGNAINLCDKLVNYGQALWNDKTATTYELGFLGNTSYIHIRNKSMGSNINNFKTWLSNNNLEIIYPLKETTTTEITDTTLLEQLNSVGGNLDTIDEKYLKDINVKFGEKFGPVNSIVLSRSAESDNVYLSDDESIEEYGLTEIKIKDNQIMNFNDRSDYLPDLLTTLDGLEFYINDYSSTGITYLELGDMYNVSVDETIYKCLMLNDTINITQGLSEDIYTDRPDKSETDYKKADKTDRRINQAYIIVDKQNQQIEALTSKVDTLGDGYTKEEVNQLIQNASDGITNKFITNGGNNILRNTGLWFEDRSEIEYLYPSDTLYPSDDLYMSADPHWEYWVGNAKKIKEDKAVNMSGILLQLGYLEQQQQVRNGTYTLSFKYRKLIQLANCNLQINDTYIQLTETQDTEIVLTFEVSSLYVDIKLFSDTNDACVIYDLMINIGSEKAEYSQHQNETTTESVNISEGITIKSSNTNTTFKANSDGIRMYNNQDMDNPVTEYTDTGMNTNRVNVSEEAQIVQVLWKNVGNNTWISRL